MVLPYEHLYQENEPNQTMPAHLPVQGIPKSAWFGTIHTSVWNCAKLDQTMLVATVHVDPMKLPL